MSPENLGAKLQEVWRAIVEAEAARAAARGTAAEAATEQAYQEALARFRHIQLEAFTVSLGNVELIMELLDEYEARIARLERAVGDPPAKDPLSPY